MPVEVSPEQHAKVPGAVKLCFQTFGDPSDPALLLIMGLGGPMTWWHDDFCTLLAEQGLFVIRYDNRDVGRSTRFDHATTTRADVVMAFWGVAKGPYSLADMAGDAVGLLDHLGVQAAHVVGVSMGGMIAQTMAIDAGDRVLSLTSIMSTTGAKTKGFQSPRMIPNLLASVEPTREGYIERAIASARLIESPGYPTSVDDHLHRAEVTWERGWAGAGIMRHMLAVLTQPNRTKALGRLTIPTTVIHGTRDPLVHVSGGKATARAVPGARLRLIDGMAHDLPRALWPVFTEEIVATVAQASA